MGRSKSGQRASLEKKAESTAAGVNPKKRLATALKAKGAPRPIWDPPRMSVTPSHKVKAEPKSPKAKMEKADIQKIKDELSSETASGRTLRSSTSSAAAKVTDKVKKAAQAAIRKIKDELSAESPPEPTLPSPTTSVASRSKKSHSGRALRSSTASTAGRIEKIKEELPVESSPGTTLHSSAPSSTGKSKKTYSGKTRRSSTAAARRTATKKVKKELPDAPYHGPTLRSSATSSSGNVEPYSAPTLRSSGREEIQRIKEELSSEAPLDPASDLVTVAMASEPEDEPEIEPQSQPVSQHEAAPEAEQEAEPEVEPEHEEAQRTMASHRYGDHRNCPRCTVWGWEYPPLHVIDEEEE
ncbi:hypothetical protein QBC45DRAFT_473260, partial [Copromyces sp. CBS 386.78]